MIKTARHLLFLLFFIVLAGCGKQEPISIGFIGGLTGPNSDNGQAGLNGVTFAVEEFNRAGGVKGRLVELVAKDDGQSKSKAEASTQELVEAKVQAIIGPFTSGMAEIIVPIAGKAGIFEVSPTITSMDFYGKDDNLFRINRTTRDNAIDYAKFLTAQGIKQIAVAYDLRNRNFTESWLTEFKMALNSQGGHVVAAIPYESGSNTPFESVMEKMLQAKPEGLLFISGALDVARLAQQARRQAPALPIIASEWAATEQLIDLGGKVVEGLIIVQNYDRDDQSDRFKQFSQAYFKRFQRYPGYSSVSAYDAATVVLQALKNQRKGETVKESALRSGPYQGLQQMIVFDKNGDTPRKIFFTRISNGQYEKLQ
ncbi:ABC transporter substrate-binding protein [Zwartia sp.]|uniref:ABC transporter substrate-binding protein n=1 Tax=Zwartia sp. TaxID=2978004 RepID=UPI002722A993|nr:ABC transporter substrate-binding protein [Zwartia sp.]MDO9026186.1 ABC transporter substrate-binding protein [Zwartia sp.]